MPTQADFQTVFAQLRKILEPFEPHLLVKANAPGNYSLDAPYSEQYKKEVFFGAVQVKKNYVSFHLMPVYMFPELLDGVSPELRARMQGKSCFNFKTLDPNQVKELTRLTTKCFARFKRAKLVR
jgi:hypothetical protein